MTKMQLCLERMKQKSVLCREADKLNMKKKNSHKRENCFIFLTSSCCWKLQHLNQRFVCKKFFEHGWVDKVCWGFKPGTFLL